MEQAKDILNIFDLFFGFGSIVSAGFFYFIYQAMKERHDKFKNSISHEGIVIDAGHRSHPVIEYESGGKTIQFTSSLNAPGVKAGQKIDLELSQNGVARIKSNGHTAILIGLMLTSVTFLVAGCIFLLNRFA